ncbi:alkaline phosphatase family protein [Anditalea andensis]|uniref:Alkaline phosphatase n=1 Tax=Anditalea andensis TaxID=1048983 RepID=A0A074LH77_9BACT|nr:alkaline phosphatase family protein [Anditalea andensis]KEO73112.1 alkaline phosphatase [Anditalea andensis]
MKLRHLGIIIFLFFLCFRISYAQTPDKPKLVVGIIVDGMRHEYLYKYYDRFTEGGFKRLMNDGYMMSNTHINYIPTLTAPGHASIYTGATPSVHGIIANDWFVKPLGKSIYSAEDQKYSNVGGSARYGHISPQNLKSTTITDELRLSTNNRSKVVSISLKERGAVFSAGHLGNALWMDGQSGEFMTSTYYMDTLPSWVHHFNSLQLTQRYLSQTWNTLYPIETYIQSVEDAFEFEGKFKGLKSSNFPYDLSTLKEKNGGMNMIMTTPFGNSLTFDMAYAALEGENLGKGQEVDFLALSLSSTDFIGHKFGPTAVETEDTYLRVDRDLENFLQYMDMQYGKNEYLVFMTSDHGMADLVEYLGSEQVPSGRLNKQIIIDDITTSLNEKFGLPFNVEKMLLLGIVITACYIACLFYFRYSRPYLFQKKYLVILSFLYLAIMAMIPYQEFKAYRNRLGGWVSDFSNEQFYINSRLADEKGIDMSEIQTYIANRMLQYEGVKHAYTATDLKRQNYTNGSAKDLQLGFNHKSSGDVMLILEPGWLNIDYLGTTHNTGYNYNTHVPLIFFGWNIPQGQSMEYCTITNLAPTLSMLLNISLPGGATGQPIMSLFDQ